MTTIAELSPILQTLLTEKANALAKAVGFIQRQREVSGANFAQSVVFGGLANPQASGAQQHHAAVMSGMKISRQGLDKRFNERAVVFMRALLEEAIGHLLTSDERKPIFPHFKGVYITDCSQTEVGGLREKLAVRLELQQGQLQLRLEAWPTHDQKTTVINEGMPAGAVHMGDLGFFNLKRFNQWSAQGIYWLTRLKTGTGLYDAQGQPLEILTLLQQSTSETTGQTVSIPIQLGNRERVGAFLVAQRVSEAVYQKRLAQFKELRRRQHPVSELRQALACWTIYVTNISGVSFEQAHILARARWQIELLFKLWKHHAHLTHSQSARAFRQQSQYYARLLALLISHWTLLVTGWLYLDLSHVQALRVIQAYALAILRAFASRSSLNALWEHIRDDLHFTARLSSRKTNPLAFQFWRDFETFAA